MSLLIASCFCCMIIMYIFFFKLLNFMIIMFTPPPTSQCENCSGRAPAWSCSLPELSFPSSRRRLFCSLVIVRFAFLVVICFALCLLYALSEQQALSFWLLFVLVAAVLLIVVHFMMSAARKRSLYNCFFLFWVALSFLCICCGVLPARRYSSRDCIKL